MFKDQMTNEKCTHTHRSEAMDPTTNGVLPQKPKAKREKTIQRKQQPKGGKRNYLLEGIHGGGFGDMDTVILIGVSFAPTIQNNQTDDLALGQFGMIRQFPRES